MPDNAITRRTFVSGTAAAGGAAMLAANVPRALAATPDLTRLPVDFGPCPLKLEEFLRYIVQRRVAEGLNRVGQSKHDPSDPRFGTVFDGTPHDMYLAWSAVAPYRYKWSRFHGNVALRNRAFVLIDATCRVRANGQWDDGGLNSYFGFHGLALAVLSWKETGDVDAARLATWVDCVTKSADDGLLRLHYGPYKYSALTAQYANPEMYFLAGLAAAWKLTGNENYKIQAAHGLARYNEWLFQGGGLAYFLESAPVHNYQLMAVKSVALYWQITQDPAGLDFLKRLAPYFPDIVHRSGIVTDAEQPQIKHIVGYRVNPGGPAIIAAILRDGSNRWAADALVGVWADSVDNKLPSWGKFPTDWFNYQLTTYAATALTFMEEQGLPAAVAPNPRRVFLDHGFRGVRSHWDDFTAATASRQMTDSVAGAYLADPHEKLYPLDAGVDGVFFEIIQSKPGVPGAEPKKIEFVCTEWAPILNYATTDGFSTQSSITRLTARFWSEIAHLAGEEGNPPDQDSDWTSIQHWGVWQDHLIGFGALRAHAAGGNAGDVARVRWRVTPISRKLKIGEQTETALRFQYGRLQADLICLDQKGGAVFKPEDITESPRLAWTPLLTRSAPWSAGDYANVATVIRPEGARGTVQTKAVKNGGAVCMLEPGGLKGNVWITNLTRGTQHFLMDVPAGVTVDTIKRNVHLPPVPSGQPAHAGLLGGESVIWSVASSKPMDATALLATVRLSPVSPIAGTALDTSKAPPTTAYPIR